MIRNIGLEDISDGRLYSENDLVRIRIIVVAVRKYAV